MRSRLYDLNKRWNILRRKSLDIRSRLESNSTQWFVLLSSLKELIEWCKEQQKQILLSKHSLQPDLNVINRQLIENKVLANNIEYKKPIIESTLASAKLYYDDRITSNKMKRNDDDDQRISETDIISDSSLASSPTTYEPTTQQELPASTNSNSILNGLKKKINSKKKKHNNTNSEYLMMMDLKIKEDIDDKEKENNEIEIKKLQAENEEEFDDDEIEESTLFLDDPNLKPNEIADILVSKIEKNVKILDKLWQELNRQSLNFTTLLLSLHQMLTQINKSFELINQKINEKEQIINRSFNGSIDEIEHDKLAEEFESVKNFQLHLSSLQPLIDEISSLYLKVNQLLEQCGNSLNLNRSSTQSEIIFKAKYDDLNQQWNIIQNKLQKKYLNLHSLIESSGANIFLKLVNESVQSPWQRSVSNSNKVPYYIK